MSYEKLDDFVLATRWMQEQDLDVVNGWSSHKGFGKSSGIIQYDIRYIGKFGLTCVRCGHDFVFTGEAIREGGRGIRVVKEIDQRCPRCDKETKKTTGMFNFKKYLAYDNDEVREMIYTLDPYSPIHADEGVRFMMGEDWMKSENKEMKKLFAQMRTKRFSVNVAIPKFKWLDTKYREDMTTFWIRIIRRGTAVVLMPDLGESDDVWHLKEFQKYLGHINYFTPLSVIQQRLDKLMSKHPCVHDIISIPPVPAPIYAKYKEMRDLKAFERKGEEQIDLKLAAKVASYNLMQDWDELKAAVEKSKLKRPTHSILRDFVFKNPNSGEPLCSSATVRRYHKVIEDLVGKKRKEDEQGSKGKV